MAEQDERKKDDGRLVENLALEQERRRDAEEVPAAHRERDQDRHVEGSVPERPPRPDEEDPAAPQDRWRREQEHEQIGIHPERCRQLDPEHVRCQRRVEEDRDGEDERDEEAVAHVAHHRVHAHPGAVAHRVGHLGHLALGRDRHRVTRVFRRGHGGHCVAGVLGARCVHRAVRARAADDRWLLVATQAARHDLPAARATEVFDQVPDIVGRQCRLVVADAHCLRDRVRLRALDTRASLQVLLEAPAAARAQEAPGLKDVAGQGVLRSIVCPPSCSTTPVS